MTKNSYHHGNLKHTILSEALHLLNSKNFDEISFRLISRNIGVVSSAPYNHFKDKKHRSAVSEKNHRNAVTEKTNHRNAVTEKNVTEQT